MAEKQTRMRYDEGELNTIKNAFADNEPLCMALRKVFLQDPLSEKDETVIKQNLVGKPEVFAVISKTFLPVLDTNAPPHQIVDLWLTIDIKDKTPEQAIPHILSRDLLIHYLEQQLDNLGCIGTDEALVEEIKFNDLALIEDKDPVTVYSDLMTRNTIITHVEQQLGQLLFLAGQKNETVAQTQARLRKNSSQ